MTQRLEQYNLIIGVTSLWLLNPVLNGLINIYMRKKEIISAYSFLTIWTLFTCCVSAIMWKTCMEKTFIYKLDIFCAKIEFCTLLLYCILFENFTIWFRFLFPIGVSVTYTITTIFHNNKLWYLNTWAHLIFRYIGYWWVHFSLIQDINIKKNFIILTVLYYTHIIIKIKLMFKNKRFNIKNNYIPSMVELLILIGFFGLLTNM